MIHSVAEPGVTGSGVHELRRRWVPEGQPWAELVLVHGLGEHSGRYERTGSLLASGGLNVTSFDLIGFGASGGTRAYVGDWTELLDQIGEHVDRAAGRHRPVVLLGHSLGGLLALEYTLSERTRPAVLVISAPALFGGAAWQRAVAPLAAAIGPRLTLPNGLEGSQLSRDPAVGQAYFADPLVVTKTTTRFGAEMFSAMDRVNAAVDRLEVPTLVVHGGADSIVPPSATEPIEALPHVERTVYPTLRHETFNEPEGPSVVADVISWIRSQVAPDG